MLYKNLVGSFLFYYKPLAQWRIGEDFTKPNAMIASAQNSTVDDSCCPEDVERWNWWDGKAWQEHEMNVIAKEADEEVITTDSFSPEHQLTEAYEGYEATHEKAETSEEKSGMK